MLVRVNGVLTKVNPKVGEGMILRGEALRVGGDPAALPQSQRPGRAAWDQARHDLTAATAALETAEALTQDEDGIAAVAAAAAKVESCMARLATADAARNRG